MQTGVEERIAKTKAFRSLAINAAAAQPRPSRTVHCKPSVLIPAAKAKKTYATQKAYTLRSMGKSYDIPALVVKDSNIENGGHGVFAQQGIKQGILTTEYGGEVIHNRKVAIERRNNSTDSHIRRAGSIFHGQFLDSSIKDEFTLNYYSKNAMLGGMVNDHGGRRDKTLTANVKVKEIEEYYIHPYSKQAVVTTRVFYVATRNIEEGEELIC